VTHLFVDSFARPIGEWCAKQGIAFTGHILSEDSLSSQTGVAGDCMRFYEHMQIRAWIRSRKAGGGGTRPSR